MTQVNTWSWRYTPNQTEQSVTLDANKTVAYTQTRAHESDGDNNNKWKWLNGQHWIDNRWKDGSPPATFPAMRAGTKTALKIERGAGNT